MPSVVSQWAWSFSKSFSKSSCVLPCLSIRGARAASIPGVHSKSPVAVEEAVAEELEVLAAAAAVAEKKSAECFCSTRLARGGVEVVAGGGVEAAVAGGGVEAAAAGGVVEAAVAEELEVAAAAAVAEKKSAECFCSRRLADSLVAAKSALAARCCRW